MEITKTSVRAPRTDAHWSCPTDLVKTTHADSATHGRGAGSGRYGAFPIQLYDGQCSSAPEDSTYPAGHTEDHRVFLT